MTLEERVERLTYEVNRLTEKVDALGGEAKKKADDRPAEERVRELLIELGCKTNLLGYRYALSSVTLVANDRNLIHAITKDLYPAVAAQYGTTVSRVERAIRHAIEVIFDNCDIDILNRIFGNTVSAVKGRPTNAEFIALLAEYVTH